jgi:DNA-binding NarL/FixJ family response regulator
MSNRKRVFVIDQQSLFALGIQKTLEEETPHIFCGHSDDARKSVSILPRAKPDLVIIDFALAHGAGVHYLAELRAARPQARILLIAQTQASPLLKKAKRIGAHGIFFRHQAPRELSSLIKNLFLGDTVFKANPEHRKTPQILSKAKNKIHVKSAHKYVPEVPEESLTPRELEVFELLGQGLGTRRIATLLALSPKTIESHCANIKAKFNLSSNTELVKRSAEWAMRQQPSWGIINKKTPKNP